MLRNSVKEETPHADHLVQPAARLVDATCNEDLDTTALAGSDLGSRDFELEGDSSCEGVTHGGTAFAQGSQALDLLRCRPGGAEPDRRDVSVVAANGKRAVDWFPYWREGGPEAAKNASGPTTSSGDEKGGSRRPGGFRTQSSHLPP